MEQTLVFKDVAIVSEFTKFAPVLKIFGNQERLAQSDLQRRAGLSQGEAYRVFHDAKFLGLLKNGDGLSITPLGRQWVREADDKGLPTPATLRQAALNVPLFAQAMRDLPEVRHPDQIYTYFWTYPDFVDRLVIGFTAT